MIKKYHHKHCKVELEGKFTKGQLIVDWWESSKIKPNIIIPVEVDTVFLLFRNYYLDNFKKLISDINNLILYIYLTPFLIQFTLKELIFL